MNRKPSYRFKGATAVVVDQSSSRAVRLVAQAAHQINRGNAVRDGVDQAEPLAALCSVAGIAVLVIGRKRQLEKQAGSAVVAK